LVAVEGLKEEVMADTDAIHLDAALSARLEDYAHASGMSFATAFETALTLGLELCVAETVRTTDRVARLEENAREMALALDVVGAATMGIRALLVAWAAKEAFGVSEDEMLAEVEATGRSEWDYARVEGTLVPATNVKAAEE
jgi:hypothetical protein